MKKLTTLILILCLMLLCGCSAANSADLAAAKESGAAGVWYCNLFGKTAALTLKDDLTCTMTIEHDGYSYRGTWRVSEDTLTIDLIASKGSWISEVAMGEMTFAVSADALTSTTEGMEFFIFRREMPAALEAAPVRSDAVLEDFLGEWAAEMISLNGIILEINGIVMAPADLNAAMTVSIGTTSAAVEIAAVEDTVYLFPLTFENGTVTMTLDDMVMTAQLHEDGMMSISGKTPLHDTVFTEDAPLVIYMTRAEEDLG